MGLGKQGTVFATRDFSGHLCPFTKGVSMLLFRED